MNGQDTLTFTNTAAITGSFNTTTGVLTLTGSTTPANYQAALRSVQFTNTAGSATSKTITFQADDGAAANHASGTVSRTVAINLAPTVTGETFAGVVGNTPLLLGVAQGSTAAEVVAGSVLSNDADPSPSSNPISINGNTTPSHGTLTLNADGTFAYVPAAGYAGADSFTYTVKDSLGAVSQPATVRSRSGRRSGTSITAARTATAGRRRRSTRWPARSPRRGWAMSSSSTPAAGTPPRASRSSRISSSWRAGAISVDPESGVALGRHAARLRHGADARHVRRQHRRRHAQ